MFTQEDKQEILSAIAGNREAIAGNREAIEGVRSIAESNREAIECVRGIAESNFQAIAGVRGIAESNHEAIEGVRGIAESNREAIEGVRGIAESNREAIKDNAEAIALLGEQLEEHKMETRSSFQKTYDLIDRRITELRVDLMLPSRMEDQKVNRVVEKLHEKQIFSVQDVSDVFVLHSSSK